MPRKQVDFSKTVVYHFICKDDTIKCSYVGSTTSFIKRKYCHKTRCQNEKDRGFHLKLYQTIRDNGGWDNWNMMPLEEFACESRIQQNIREQYWVNQLNPNLNQSKAHRSEEDLFQYHKDYYEKNKEQIQAYRKEYYEKHKNLNV
jgi:hypothetical protein